MLCRRASRLLHSLALLFRRSSKSAKTRTLLCAAVIASTLVNFGDCGIWLALCHTHIRRKSEYRYWFFHKFIPIYIEPSVKFERVKFRSISLIFPRPSLIKFLSFNLARRGLSRFARYLSVRLCRCFSRRSPRCQTSSNTPRSCYSAV